MVLNFKEEMHVLVTLVTVFIPQTIFFKLENMLKNEPGVQVKVQDQLVLYLLWQKINLIVIKLFVFSIKKHKMNSPGSK